VRRTSKNYHIINKKDGYGNQINMSVVNYCNI
jgi:hypothetical protein